LECEFVVILLDLNSLELPELMRSFLRYFVSAIHVTLTCVENHPLNTFRWLHVRGYATTYVILISLLLVSELRR